MFRPRGSSSVAKQKCFVADKDPRGWNISLICPSLLRDCSATNPFYSVMIGPQVAALGRVHCTQSVCLEISEGGGTMWHVHPFWGVHSTALKFKVSRWWHGCFRNWGQLSLCAISLSPHRCRSKPNMGDHCVHTPRSKRYLEYWFFN